MVRPSRSSYALPHKPEGATLRKLRDDVSDHGPKRSRILVIDDHPLVRRGVSDMLTREPDFEVCGEAESEAHGLELIRTARPDLIIMDLALREGSGLDLIHRVRAVGISVPILVLSMREETVFAERVIREMIPADWAPRVTMGST
jgi:CheY-like chemotaxis protein